MSRDRSPPAPAGPAAARPIWLSAALAWIGRPSPRLTDPTLLRKSQLLAYWSAFTIPLFMAVDSALLLCMADYRPPWFGYVLLLGVFFANRAGFYELGAWAAGSVMTLVVLTQLWRGAAPDPALVLSWLPVGLLLGLSFLPLRGVALLTTANVFGIVLLRERVPALHDTGPFVLVLSANGVGGAAALLYAMHRNQVEADRCHESERSQERLSLALEAARTGIWDWDLLTDRVVVTPAVEAIFAVPPGQFGSDSSAYFERIHPEDREQVHAHLDAALRDGRDAVQYSHRICTPDGGVRTLDVRGRVRRDPAGVPLRMTGTVVDVSEQRLLEAQLRHAQKMEVIGRLAGGIAHDFNNMLAVIIGNAELLSMHGEREELAQIRAAADTSSKLTRQLLAFSRRALLRPAVADLGEVVSATAKMLERIIGEDVRVELCGEPGLWHTRVDRAQVQESLLNLATNARDAMHAGGVLTLRTRNRPGMRFVAHDGSSRAGDYVELSVSDTGEGISPEARAHLFEPFYTTKEVGKGTGLGLAMVFGIMSQSDGHIVVESEPGRGTTVGLLFKRCDEPLPQCDAAQPGAAFASLARAKELVLLVEDEASVRNLCRELLVQHGYRVLCAADAAEARALFAAHRAELAALVTDIVMPGTSGPDLAGELRGQLPALAVLFMSGYAEAESWRSRPGFLHDEFVAKPFESRELLQKLAAAIERTRSVRASRAQLC